ncbi:flagellar assembly protein FliH [Alloalcanivorax sp. C16-2]|uniref:flagellar assembly protein FliH n=1 Tax=Alloalcanivorax TaxID=3020832 RepID=UPI0019329FC7|nr:flagellar assembly protein FliH [Alloalcanivorax marinus]MBL7251708.1 flagellar assembly protein FliH [Alloalcanivorax marinus]
MSETRFSNLAGWRPWRMGELDDRHRAGAVMDDDRDATFDHQSELRALRDKVREQARQEGYRAGFEEGHREGHAQGLQEGRRQGEEETDRQRAETLAPLAELARGFGDALASLDEGVAEELVELALTTGRQLAGDALRERPEQVLAVVRELIHDEPSLNGKTRLWLHPDDLTLVERELGAELAAAGWKLHPDDQLGRGGCRVTSPSGELDATWESRWAAVSGRVRRRRRPGQDSGEPTS